MMPYDVDAELGLVGMPFPIVLYRTALRGNNLMEGAVQVAGHLQNQSGNAVCGFLSFAKRLFWTNRDLAAICNVFLIGLPCLVFVYMAAVKHQRGEFHVFRFQAVQDIDIENLL